jgi:hypothetical protein
MTGTFLKKRFAVLETQLTEACGKTPVANIDYFQARATVVFDNNYF